MKTMIFLDLDKPFYFTEEMLDVLNKHKIPLVLFAKKKKNRQLAKEWVQKYDFIQFVKIDKQDKLANILLAYLKKCLKKSPQTEYAVNSGRKKINTALQKIKAKLPESKITNLRVPSQAIMEQIPQEKWEELQKLDSNVEATIQLVTEIKQKNNAINWDLSHYAQTQPKITPPQKAQTNLLSPKEEKAREIMPFLTDHYLQEQVKVKAKKKTLDFAALDLHDDVQIDWQQVYQLLCKGFPKSWETIKNEFKQSFPPEEYTQIEDGDLRYLLNMCHFRIENDVYHYTPYTDIALMRLKNKKNTKPAA